jgi:ABC-type transport system involved in multi-copper enzyme maturation permease subunit
MGIIFKITFRQLLRQPLLWWLCFGVIILSEITPSFAEVVAFGNIEQAVLNCSQGIAWFGVIMSVLISSHLVLGKELDEKVALTLFTKPLPHFQFLMGKFFALLGFNLILFLVQSLMILKIGWTYEWSEQGFSTFFMAITCVMLQGFMIMGLSIFCTCCFGTSISLWMTVLIWVLPYLLSEKPMAMMAFFFPLWDRFDITYSIFHGLEIDWFIILPFSLYAISYLIAMVLLASLVLKEREY